MADLTAREIMTTPVVTVPQEITVKDVAHHFAEHKISGVVVVDGEGRALGVITESDLVRRVAHPHLPPQVNILGSIFFLDSPSHMEQMMKKMVGATAREIMSSKLVTADPDTPVRDVADLMVEHKVGRVPILEDGRPIGIVTRHDLVTRVLATGDLP